VAAAATLVDRLAPTLTQVRSRWAATLVAVQVAFLTPSADEPLRCEQHWAVELYNNGVKPWLRDLQLDWCDADGGESTFSAGAHAEWLSDSTLAHLAVDIAAADTALLSCCLTLERYVVRRLHPANECALAHIPQLFACKAPRCLALDEACEMPSGH